MRSPWSDARTKLVAIGLLAIVTGACGYRPAAHFIADAPHRSAVVPAFASSTGQPELEVFAGEHLASRLTALGVSVGPERDGATLLVRGVILSSREVPLGLHPDYTTVQIELDTRVDVSHDGRDSCTTSVATGTATLSVPFDSTSEPALLTAMQAAAADAIEQLLLDVMLCVRSHDTE